MQTPSPKLAAAALLLSASLCISSAKSAEPAQGTPPAAGAVSPDLPAGLRISTIALPRNNGCEAEGVADDGALWLYAGMPASARPTKTARFQVITSVDQQHPEGIHDYQEKPLLLLGLMEHTMLGVLADRTWAIVDLIQNGIVTPVGNDDVAGFATLTASPLDAFSKAPIHSAFLNTDSIETDAAAQSDGSVIFHTGPVQPGQPMSDQEKRAAVIKTVPGVPRAQKLSAGDGAGGLIDPGGHVWVWGITNYMGESTKYLALRGSKTAFDPAHNDPLYGTPVLVDGIEHAVDIQLGWDCAIALKDDGSVWQWSASVRPHKIFDHIRLPLKT